MHRCLAALLHRWLIGQESDVVGGLKGELRQFGSGHVFAAALTAAQRPCWRQPESFNAVCDCLAWLCAVLLQFYYMLVVQIIL